MVEHEESFLSCILLDPSIMYKTGITEAYFQYEPARRLFRAMVKCSEAGVKIDYIALGDFDRELDKTYAPRVYNVAPSSANWKHYERLITANYQRARLQNLGLMLSNMEDTESPAAYIERAEKELFQLATGSQAGEVKKIAELVPEALKHIEERFKAKGALPGLATGISNLDAMIGGLQPSKYYIIGARPSDGKSALAVNMVCHIGINQGQSVGLISAESSNTEIVTRIFSSEGRINGTKLSMGLLGRGDFDKLLSVGENLASAPVYVYDAPNVGFTELRSIARQMVASYKVKALFVDYIQIIQWDNQKIPFHEQVTNVSKSLKGLARELRIPIVGLAQLRRDAEGREPNMADLGDSSQLEKDADALVFIYHPQKAEDDASPSKLLVKKNRDGAKGAVNVTFVKEYVKFVQEGN